MGPAPRPRRAGSRRSTDVSTRPAAPVDSAYLAQSVRKDTADLASYALSHGQHKGSPAFLGRTVSRSPPVSETSTIGPGKHGGRAHNDQPRRASSSQIALPFQPPAPQTDSAQESPSMLTNLLRSSPPGATHEEGGSSNTDDAPRPSSDEDADGAGEGSVNGTRLAREGSRLETVPEVDEQTPLLSRDGSKQGSVRDARGTGDVEAQGPWRPSGLRGLQQRARSGAAKYHAILSNPSKWDGRAIWQGAVATPASYMPAVVVGLLLNILDALSYGMSGLIARWSGTTANRRRHDSLPPCEPHIFTSWISGHFHLLC